MWLGEQITANGVGNGISIIIFAGIVAGVPTMVNQVIAQQFANAGDELFIRIITVLLIVIAIIAIIVGVIFVPRGIKKNSNSICKACCGWS